MTRARCAVCNGTAPLRLARAMPEREKGRRVEAVGTGAAGGIAAAAGGDGEAETKNIYRLRLAPLSPTSRLVHTATAMRSKTQRARVREGALFSGRAADDAAVGPWVPASAAGNQLKRWARRKQATSGMMRCPWATGGKGHSVVILCQAPAE
eukprot:scaffold14030_cov121-Isochrysis_galbana.AAC.5